ncbi:hypothetical protein DITRI_Ditri09bG0061700 [Diplodiscus trichospermus]
MAHLGGGAEAHARFKQYEYRANSSLVLTTDSRPRRPPELDEKLKKSKKKKERDPFSEPVPVRQSKRRRLREESVLNVMEEGVYQPKTKETRAAYEAMLSLIQQQLGGQALNIVSGAVDEILAVLKNEGIKNPDKKEIEKLLNPIPSQVFDQLVSIGKLITDYQDGGDGGGGSTGKGDEGLDDDVGVAVEFEENEDEEEESDLDIVQEDEEDDDDVVENGAGAMQMGGGIDDDDMHEAKEGMSLNVQDIDAYWLQRKISQAYDQNIDPQQCQKLAEEVLKILAEGDDREVETKLLVHLRFKMFDLIKYLLWNRLKVVWCTRLARAEDQEERKKIEEEMMTFGPDLAAIVEQLHATRATAKERQKNLEKSIREEARRLKDESGGNGDRDRRGLADRDTDGGWLKGQLQLLDLDSLAFEQGGLLMANKKCDLPVGSYRHFSKGYEEVHVPALKPKPLESNERLVKISEMPDWAQPAFKGMQQLNRQLALNMDSDGSINHSNYKIVYVAPMKALVAEVVGNLSHRLEAYGVTVRELSGDQTLSRQQIEETQIIVTTPEKWDIITRKSGDRTYTQLVKLLIIDEIHLLHDNRGPVLESIVARTVRQIETTKEHIRLVGLSATLPNFEDVALFLQVNLEKVLFHFDNSYRPVPLSQQFIGITVKKPLQRKKTAKTARVVRDTALANDTLSRFLKEDAASREILQSHTDMVRSNDLKDLLPYGFAIHHAGLARTDRQIVEELFAHGHVQVLMLGRAGRPQYDSYREGIIITGHSELQYYLSLMNQQLPIESQFISKLADQLNAEIVLGTVQNAREACNWIGYTYLYIRMLRNPTLYGLPADVLSRDLTLEERRTDLIHSAATILDKNNLIKYDRKSGYFQVTDLGRIAKFKYVTVRQEEKIELAKLLDRVPIPIKESLEEPSVKINLKLEGLSLTSDMVYISQSAGRLLRALFEIVLKRGWAQLAEKALNLCKMVTKRMWNVQTPLRQFNGIPNEILLKLEKKDLAWDRYYDLSSQEIGELIRLPKMGRTLHRFIHQFPQLNLAAHVQPITRTVLRVELTITPDFQWEDKVHGYVEPFWVIVEDNDGEYILHHEYFLLKKQHLILPEKYPPPTKLLDLQPLPVTALRNPSYEALYQDFKHFNLVQTQVFTVLYNTDDNVLVVASTGSEKTICAEFAILRNHQKGPDSTMRVVYIAPLESMAKERYRDWERKFGRGLGMRVVELTGELAMDLKLLEKGQIVISTPEKWDALSRRWKQRKYVQQVSLFIVDELHLIGGQGGPVLEVIVSRMRYVASQFEKIRIVGLSTSLANAKDLGEWIGATSHGLFNFPPGVRPVPLEIHIQGVDIANFEARMLAMTKPTYTSIFQHAKNGKPAIVFVPTRKHVRLTAVDLMSYSKVDNEDRDVKRASSSGFGLALTGFGLNGSG